MPRTFAGFAIASWISLALLPTNAVLQEAETNPDRVEKATHAVESDVQAQADSETELRRQRIMEEAIDALDSTRDALKALEEQRIEDAIDFLATATGRLEIIIARDPSMALAPTDVTVIERDVLGTKDAIREAIGKAEEALDDRNIQEARRLLDGLGSEIVLSVTSLPLATFPEAVKAIVPLIEEGKIEAAKAGLQAALNTLVVTDHILPLPILRAQELLARAEELSEITDRSAEENDQLASNLAAARNQLEMAELLGYGDPDEYEELYSQLDRIEERTEGGKSGLGFFANIKDSISELWLSVSG